MSAEAPTLLINLPEEFASFPKYDCVFDSFPVILFTHSFDGRTKDHKPLTVVVNRMPAYADGNGSPGLAFDHDVISYIRNQILTI